MIGANQYKLTWNNFNHLHEDKNKVFENLSRSLFIREFCQENTILHSDSNHPGIEVEPVFAKDGHTRISFQAKYFDNSVGYNQIKKSIDEVISHYTGKLDLIYLYCNKDVTKTCKSYIEILKRLNSANIEIKLVTGQTILDLSMNYPSILSCYFGIDSLDDKWFKDNINLSLENMGKRYNQLFNISTEAQSNISLFLRDADGINKVNSKKKNILARLKELMSSSNGKYMNEISDLSKWIKSLADIDIKSFTYALNWKNLFEKECNEVFTKLRDRLSIIKDKLKSFSYEDKEYKKIGNEIFTIESILEVVSLFEFSRIETSLISSKVAIITGEMGTGKSQLLAISAKKMVENNRLSLLLLGQTFISDEIIENQIMNNLDGPSKGLTFESLISIMDEKSLLKGEDAIIFIDAINESRNRDCWKNGINRVIAILNRYNNVKLVVSLRTGFEELTLSQSVLDKKSSGEIATINHSGFFDESPSKIYEFLSSYGIPFSPEYYLRSEMTNPLFLTWFCSVYGVEEEGLLSLINKILEKADQEGSKAIGSEKVGILRPLIYDMLDLSIYGVISKQKLLKLNIWDVYGVTNKIGYLNAIERSGVLTSFIQDNEENFYIGFNLLGDYFKASKILDREKSKEKIIEYCEKVLFDIDNKGKINNYGNYSIFTMLVSLYSIKQEDGLEDLIDKVKNQNDKNRMIDAYYSSFIWRSSYITYHNFLDILEKYPPYQNRVWEVFIENATKEKSELNALGLTKFLMRYQINKRDFIWTKYINDYDINNRIINLAYYIEAGNTLEGLSDNKAYLLSITYAWMLSSSNRYLRDRVSKAMIEILKDHFEVCIQLLELFKEVNDPYILQRLYSVVFGVVMRRKNENKLAFKLLAEWIYNEIFDKKMVYPDILLRDYARLIIERYAFEFPNDLDNIQLPKIKPPYKSEPIPIVEEVDYSAEEYLENGLYPLLYSMKFDINVKGIGMYGDFGRYIFQSALNDFVDLDMVNIYYYSIQYILDKLGYNTDYFADYDKCKNSYNRYYVKKIERIGKKYQWIAMYNILARVSDTHNIGTWNGSDRVGVVYEGPWNPYVRDFDPTLNTKIYVKKDYPKFLIPQYGYESFCDILSSEEEVDRWIKENDKMFQDFPKRFIHTDKIGREWISLYLCQENEFKPEENERSNFDFSKGEQRIWIISTMYIIKEEKKTFKQQDLIDISKYNNIPNCYSLFSREYAWSPGYISEFENNVNEERDSCTNAFTAAINFIWEEEYDASQEESISLLLPAGQIIQEMYLYEKDVNGIFYRNEELVALDLTLLGNKNKEIVIRKDVFDEFLEKTGFQAFWRVIGEKQFFFGDRNQKWQKREGYFKYSKEKIVGSMELVNDERDIL